MGNPDIQEDGKEYIDQEKLEKYFPKSHKNLLHVISVKDEIDLDGIENDREKGRQFFGEFHSRLVQARDRIVNDIIDTYFTFIEPDKVYERYKFVKKRIYTSLKFPHELFNPQEESKDPENVSWKEQVEWMMKDQIVRCLIFSLFFRFLNDPKYQSVFVDLMNKFQKQLQRFIDEDKTILAQLFRLQNEEYSEASNYAEFRKNTPDLKVMRVDNTTSRILEVLNDELFEQIKRERNYDLEDVYTYDHTLGKPLVVVFMNPGKDTNVRDENIASAMLVGDKKDWEKILNEKNDFLNSLRSGEGMIEQTRSAVQNVTGDGQFEKTYAEAVEILNEERVNKGLETNAFIAGSFPIGINWQDGQLYFINSHMPLEEMFAPSERNWVEVLRMSLLMKLRDLLVPGNRDKSGEVIGSLKIANRKRKRPSLSKMRPKYFPRIASPKTAQSAEIARKSPRDHQVTGFVRDLPDGWYASPEAVKRAIDLGIELAFIVDSQGNKKYTQTFVKTHRRGKEQPSISDREGKFKKQ